MESDGGVSTRIIGYRETDRKALARLLHDEAAQTLANVALQLEVCDRALAVDVDRGRAELAAARRALGDAIGRLRHLVFELRPLVLEEVGVGGTLRRYLAVLSGQDGPELELDDRLGARRLDAQVELGLFRIAQAAVANAIKHAEARRVQITLDADQTSARLVVRDDGRGFDAMASIVAARHAEPETIGHGLAVMLDWIASLRGEIDVASGTDGTSVRARVPLG